MSRSLCVLLAALSLIQGTPAIRRPQGSPQTADPRSAHHHGDRGSFNHTDAEPPALEHTVAEPPAPDQTVAEPPAPDQTVAEPPAPDQTVAKPPALTGQDMPVVQLVPGHYPARRAAQVAQHYLNTQHGSPYRWLQVERVLSATLEEVADKGMKYSVTFSVKDGVSEKSAGMCSAEVMFPANEVQSLPLQAPPSQAPPQVHCSCEDLLKTNTTVEEGALYQHLKSNASVLVDAQYIPDSFGYIAPEMRPIWHLGGAASSFVMLKESNENTLYNLAQLANVTQLESQNDTLLFQFHVLLHEMVSQEIISWKLQASWCPTEGVRVLSAEWQPKCHHCVVPPTNTTLATTPPS